MEPKKKTARERYGMEPKKNWREDPGAAKEFVANSENWRDKPGVKMRAFHGSPQAMREPEDRIYHLLHGRIKCEGCGAHEKTKWHPARRVVTGSGSVWVKSWVQYEVRGDPEKLGLQFDSGKGFMLDVNLVCKKSSCQRTGNLQIRPDPLMGRKEFFEQNIETYRIVKDGEY